MPRNIAIASTAIVTSVAAAFLASGGRNAGTPSDTASTPVIAVQPLANAVSNRNVVSGFASPSAARVVFDRHETAREVAVQPRGNEREDAHDEKVGRDREDLPDSLRPRRLPTVSDGKEEEAQLDAIGVEARKGRRDGEHAGGMLTDTVSV